jgi:hypothetical protein
LIRLTGFSAKIIIENTYAQFVNDVLKGRKKATNGKLTRGQTADGSPTAASIPACRPKTICSWIRSARSTMPLKTPLGVAASGPKPCRVGIGGGLSSLSARSDANLVEQLGPAWAQRLAAL